MSDWSSRAEAYRNAPEQREGADLDLIVEWAQGSRTALDVATGGGHVARRLREAGLEVVSADPAPGMQPDVICRAEDLPFADGSFDVVTCRVAAHHFDDPGAAVLEFARVAGKLVLVADNLFLGEAGEEAEGAPGKRRPARTASRERRGAKVGWPDTDVRDLLNGRKSGDALGQILVRVRRDMHLDAAAIEMAHQLHLHGGIGAEETLRLHEKHSNHMHSFLRAMALAGALPVESDEGAANRLAGRE